ncbi:MAG: hypothetical protein B6U76_05850 [Desulfurococcales archaeon ex4484_217_2]|nr:MAG: hypothetical protein B6U76_05850 [Desulfurococcales archaeon ex4484_217_2]
MKVLEKHRKGELKLVVSPASPIKASLTLQSHSINTETTAKILKLMRDKLAEYKANTYTPITLEAIAKTLELKKKQKTNTPQHHNIQPHQY